MVVIDSLNGYSKAMQDEKTLDLQLHEILSAVVRSGSSCKDEVPTLPVSGRCGRALHPGNKAAEDP